MPVSPLAKSVLIYRKNLDYFEVSLIRFVLQKREYFTILREYIYI